MHNSTLAKPAEPFRLADATNVYMTNEILEVEDNHGVFTQIKPPPEWAEFFQRMLEEKLKPRSTKASNFTESFLGFRYRCILAQSIAGPGINMRKLMTSVPNIRDQLKLDWNVIYPLMKGTGLTIFAGQMGSGKSTTMIAALERLGRLERGPMGTVEDPIEVIFQGGSVIQREVGTHVESFEEAIKDFVRQNRKTIMVGEIRDPETANAAVLAASTGHSVFATLHADSAIDIIPRMLTLLDVKNARVLSRTLRGLWWQHVIRHGTTARDPVPIYESVMVDNTVRQLIESGSDKLPQIIEVMRRQGRKTMAETAIAQVTAKRVTRDEVSQWLEARGRISDSQVDLRR